MAKDQQVIDRQENEAIIASGYTFNTVTDQIAGLDIGQLVPPAVASYIARHDLYGRPGAPTTRS